MLNAMLEWLAPVIGWISGLNIAYLMWAACGLMFGALIGRVILLRIEAKDLGLELVMRFLFRISFYTFLL